MAIYLSEKLAGKNLKVTLKDGTIYKGYCTGWTSTTDDPEDRENIDIDPNHDLPCGKIYCCYKDEIENIEFL
jgi:hypothetical protein